MDKKIKILGIAPYDGMRALMTRLAKQREDIDLTVYVGDLEAGAEIASKHTLQDYDVILSRGGTAEMISSISPIPVVEIQLSVYDILRAMKLAENYTDRYAIVGFPGITRSAQFLCDLLQYDIDIYTVHSPDEVYYTLTRLTTQGYRMVLCDVITNSQAQRIGMRSILFTSGTESIEAAFDQAVKTAETYQGLVSKAEFFRTLLEDYQYHIFVYDAGGELVYASSKSHTFSQSLMNTMKNYVPDLLIEKDKKFYRDEDGILVSVRGIKKEIHKQTYVAYYVNTRKVPLSLLKNGIRYIDKEQAVDQFYTSFCGMASPDSPSRLYLEKINQTVEPVIVFGEAGTGKEEMAGLIYSQSRYANKPMAIIDCSRISDKGWTFLTEHMNSPFSDTFTTIYIREMEFLTDTRFREMFSIIRDLDLHKRNRIIFSYTLGENDPIPERCRLLLNQFACLTFRIPPLRNSLKELPNIANLYISTLNMDLAKEIVGLDHEAMALLQSYEWPQNYSQFKRIMRDLALLTDTPYIKAQTVSKLLLRESPAPMEQAGIGLNLNRPLEEIDLDILRCVLAEENGNQTTTAKRLGISRTTLWRMLQKLEKE